MLRIVNSAAYSRTRKIKSLHEAIVILGQNQLRRWASLIAPASAEHKPHALMVTTMVRAKICETLAQHLKHNDCDVYFTMGMFSILDALLDMPLADILGQMSLTDELNHALLHHQGMMGMILHNIIALEKADWQIIQLPGLTDEIYQQHYFDGIE